MRHLIRVGSVLVVLAAFATPLGADGQKLWWSDGPCNNSTTRGSYGFQCHGFSSLANGGNALEPVTFVGTVDSDGRGHYDGYGTFNSSAGSAPVHVWGKGTTGPRCFGHVDYHGALLIADPPIPLPDTSFDFAVVLDGKEVLGTGVANPPLGTGNDVPRLTCRLVRIKK